MWIKGATTPAGKRIHPKLYRVWIGMRERCNNPKRDYWKWYGGKGIAVCNDWQNYAMFRAWAVSNGYQKGLTLDRIDGNGDYMPHNCRWATRKTQWANRDKLAPQGIEHGQAKLTEANVIEIRSSTKTYASLAAAYGVSVSTIAAVKWRRTWKHVPDALCQLLGEAE